MSKVLSLRVEDDLAVWADAYAKERGVSRQDLLVEGLRSFKDDCERGVPEIREKARAAALAPATGTCPKSAAGHQWLPASQDPRRACAHCGRAGRDNLTEKESGGFFAEATYARAELFSRLRAPASSGWAAKK